MVKEDNTPHHLLVAQPLSLCVGGIQCGSLSQETAALTVIFQSGEPCECEGHLDDLGGLC